MGTEELRLLGRLFYSLGTLQSVSGLPLSQWVCRLISLCQLPVGP